MNSYTEVQKDEIIKESTEPHMYQRIMEDKVWNGTQLQEDSNVSCSSRILMYYSLGWFQTECNPSSKLFLKIGTVAKVDSNHIIIILATRHHRNPQAGHCQIKDSIII